MPIRFRQPVRPERSGADFDRAASTLVLVALGAVAPALLVEMLAAVGEAAGPAPGWRALWVAAAAVVRMIGLGGLAVLGVACTAASVAALRPDPDARRGADARLSALYAAGVVAAVLGLGLLLG